MKIAELWRYKKIIDEIEKKNYPSREELLETVNNHLFEADEMYASSFKQITLRTLHRDLKKIESIFGIEINSNKREKGYEILSVEHQDEEMLRLLDSLNLFFVSQNIKIYKKYIHFESRKVNVSDTYIEILTAIKKGKKVKFLYSHYEKKATERFVSPLGLKEFKGFWYLICKDEKGIKTFGLDRITGLTITTNNFKYPQDFSLNDYYKYCYGIVRFSDSEPKEIKIKLLHIKAQYYKVNPLHNSQKIEVLDDKYSLLTMYAYLTYDLQQELRSHYKDELIVLEPKGVMEKPPRYY